MKISGVVSGVDHLLGIAVKGLKHAPFIQTVVTFQMKKETEEMAKDR